MSRGDGAGGRIQQNNLKNLDIEFFLKVIYMK
jgi:hypothetical protein